jgi:flavin-dependent dehydrogenase
VEPVVSDTHADRDVVICGGGLAGLLLARQLRRELPELAVTVLERLRRPLPDACHKVGESSVEVASQYFERLGLKDYLLERQLVKLGLRFFPGGGRLPLHERLEIGPGAEPSVRSYQLDRGRFEHDLRGMIEADGAELVEGARVREIRLGAQGAPHVVEYERDGASHTLSGRWMVDATGRFALIRRDLKLKRGTAHVASAGWYRIAGRFDISALVPQSETEWHARPCAAERWRSTNHFMGPGYWAWVIPLSTGMTSIGLVIQEELHPFSTVSSLAGVRAFLEQHEPQLAAALASWEVKDFLCLRDYSNMVARAWSADRWAIVGEAGAFVDPLYSPGSDFIALANSFTTELVRLDRAGGDVAAKALQLNAQYRAMVASTIELFRTAAPVYGHPQAMAAKVYWDDFVYWAFACRYFQQDMWELPPQEVAPFDAAGQRFRELSGFIHALLRAWAELAPPVAPPIMRPIPCSGSVLVEMQRRVGMRLPLTDALSEMQLRAGQAREIVDELLLRAVQELGPERGQVLLERARYAESRLAVPVERLDLEGREARESLLSTIARDVEHTLGPAPRHPEAARARGLLAQGAMA